MKKYRVWGLGYYSSIVEVEASSPEEAETLAEGLFPAPSLCYSCGRDFELGDIEKIEVEEI